MLLASSLLSLCLLATPVAHAHESVEWNFLNSSIPGRWEVRQWTESKPTAKGLHIQTTKDGQMVRPTEFPFPVEGIILHLGPGAPAEAMLLWHVRGTPQNDLVQLPFLIQGNNDKETVELPVNNYGQWDPLTDRLGLALPAGANVTIEKIELLRWNIVEKFSEAFRTFWTFDLFRPYSINFLWGPLLTFNPIARDRLFLSIPPMSWSANRLFYALMGLAGLLCFLQWFIRKKTPFAGRSALKKFLVVLAALWIFYDVRMGLEFLSYYVHDYTTFVGADKNTRTFRERGAFNDFADMVAPLVHDRDRYIFLTEIRWPYLGAIRYLTYPSIPTDPTQQETGVDTWVVYRRTDMDVSDDGMLLLEGEPVAGPGDVLLNFEPGSFVYRIRNPLPSPPAP